MVDQLSTFADEVTRVAREVGTEGKLGGQAQVEGVSGTWRDLTENVNQLASNLTTQVRAIAEVSTAVTQGDLTRSITVEAAGEVAELQGQHQPDDPQPPRDHGGATRQQDWLKTNLARISALMQGQRDLQTVTRLIMSELTPTVTAQHGAFFLAETTENGDGDARWRDGELRMVASYGYKKRKNVSNQFKFGEALVGQAALERKPILITEAPDDYIKVTSGLGEATPREHHRAAGPVRGAGARRDRAGLARARSTRSTCSSSTSSWRRSASCSPRSSPTCAPRSCCGSRSASRSELQSQSEELQSQQEELKRSNAELEEQAKSLKASEELLQTQQEELQQTNEELQEKAALLARRTATSRSRTTRSSSRARRSRRRPSSSRVSSKYKSEFLANMSHELRTPLNSLLILSNLLAQNEDGNLDEKQVEFAQTIHTAGSDLLALINDILDLSKVEAGKMDVHPTVVGVRRRCADYFERSFRPVAEQKELDVRDRRSPTTLPETIDDRRAAAPADPQEPAVERVQVHREGRRDAADASARADGHRATAREILQRRRPRDRVLGHRHRHRHRRATSCG